jgi:hypothetical protein
MSILLQTGKAMKTAFHVLTLKLKKPLSLYFHSVAGFVVKFPCHVYTAERKCFISLAYRSL